MGYEAGTAFVCNGCGYAHDNAKEARRCCEPEEVEGYWCDTCDLFYLDQPSADACCEPEEPKLEPQGVQLTLPPEFLKGWIREDVPELRS